MIKPDTYWVTTGHKIDDISNPQNVITFNWSKNLSADYITLSESFFNTAEIIVTEIVNDYDDNVKCDQWFFPALYLYRQAIELLCKGLLISIFSKTDVIRKFTTYKHNIVDLFKEYCCAYPSIPLSNDEKAWVNSYLLELELIDSSSSLFRYPIKNGYLSQFQNNFLDIVDMSNSIETCYSIIFKCVEPKHYPLKYSANIDLTYEPKVLFFASHGIGNCMLYYSPWDAGYYSHIQGYSNIAYFLTNKLQKDHWSFLPIAFLLRHAIELSLKYILISRTDVHVNEKIQKNKISSHVLYQDLWKNVKDMIEHYANSSGEDLNTIHFADNYLKELSALDKHGDKFRYPTTYGLEYHLQLKSIDFDHAIHWLISIFNAIDGCASMLDAIYEYECDMRTEYENSY